MSYTTFYYFQSDGSEAAADRPEPLAEAGVRVGLFDRLTTDGDFFGLLDPEGNTLQVIYQEEKKLYWFELPATSEKGSYGKLLSRAEACERIDALPASLTRAGFADFEFVSWLDDLPSG